MDQSKANESVVSKKVDIQRFYDYYTRLYQEKKIDENNRQYQQALEYEQQGLAKEKSSNCGL